MSDALHVNEWSDPRTDPVKPDCFLCGRAILRYLSKRGVAFKDTPDGPYGPQLFAHDACLVGKNMGEIEAAWRSGIIDIAEQKAKHGPW